MLLRNLIWVVSVAVFAVYASEHQEVDTSTSSIANTNIPTPIVDRSSHYHHHENPTFKGIWKKNIVWRPRWVKTWQAKKIYVAVWKKMWGPVKVNEWVPLPKPPPGWVKPEYGPVIVKAIHH